MYINKSVQDIKPDAYSNPQEDAENKVNDDDHDDDDEIETNTSKAQLIDVKDQSVAPDPSSLEINFLKNEIVFLKEELQKYQIMVSKSNDDKLIISER